MRRYSNYKARCRLCVVVNMFVSNYVNNSNTVVRCTECEYLRECRVILKCTHPCGLKRPSVDSFCSYGKQKDIIYEDKTD